MQSVLLSHLDSINKTNFQVNAVARALIFNDFGEVGVCLEIDARIE